MSDLSPGSSSHDQREWTRLTGSPVASVGTAELSRRTVLRGAGVAALTVGGVGVLAACAPSGGTTTLAAGGASSTGGTGSGTASLAKVDAIPVGGAILVKDAAGKPVILSQPTAGTVVAMTAICTHMGCTVAPAGAQLVETARPQLQPLVLPHPSQT